MNVLEELDRYGGFTHAFLTSYTFQPAFFEDRVLSCKALSGCPNIVVFVDRLTYKEVCAGSQGGSLVNRRYLLLPVRFGAGGVFHPKLWLFAGEKRSRLFLGSANLTRPGITTNMEMVSVFEYEANSEECAPLLSGAFSFVESLSERHCPRTATFEKVLAGARMYPALGGRPGQAMLSALVHNLDAPLFDALPESLTDQRMSATVFGPFFDAGIGKILDKLAGRGRLSGVEIIVQQDTNTLDTAALERWSRRNRSVRVQISAVDMPGRPFHAKGLLLQDAKGTLLLALLGSANFTEPALLLFAGNGGNVEVGLRLMGDAAAVVRDSLTKAPFKDRTAIDLSAVRSRPKSPPRHPDTQDDSVMLLSAEIDAGFTRIDVTLGGPAICDGDKAKTDLCVQRCDKALMDFTCPPVNWGTSGQASFHLSPQNAQFLNRAAKAWLSTKTATGETRVSNPVWLLHLDEVTENEKKREAKVIRQFRESGKGVTAYLQTLIDQGAIDRSVEFLENLSIRYSNDLLRLRGPLLRPRRPKSPLREDELPASLWRLTMDQRVRLGEAVKDFVERHHEKVLQRHIRNPNLNGLENFLDVLETCTELSARALQEGLLEPATVQAMMSGSLSLFSGDVLQEGYAKALRGHMWGHESELKQAYEATGTAERIAAVLVAVMCATLFRLRNVPAAMSLHQMIAEADLPQLENFFTFAGVPAARVDERAAERIAVYDTPGFFRVQLREAAPRLKVSDPSFAPAPYD